MKITKAQLIEDNRDLRKLLEASHKQTELWRTKAEQRLDTQMLDARIKLASQLGQMIEATSKAIAYIVGKEVM
jgi:hypothetical protein